MPVSEFELIETFFSTQSIRRDDVLLGIGDDCALVKPDNNDVLAIGMDTLVAGVHFPESTSAYDIGYKALAVNLSDLAAMGAQPQWLTLALTLPEADEQWLKGFSEGLFALAQRHQMQLIGGDVTRGPLTVTVQAHGRVPEATALKRKGAKPGDGVYVSGTLGDGGIGLWLQQHRAAIPPGTMDDMSMAYFIDRLNRPQPRIALGLALRSVASAAIDISDGLVADLRHILDASACGATIDVEQLPVNHRAEPITAQCPLTDMALRAGDDFELCFIVPPHQQDKLAMIAEQTQSPITRIGVIDAGTGLRIMRDGKLLSPEQSGYRHF